MNKRYKSYKPTSANWPNNSTNWLKFSNTSLTCARARQASKQPGSSSPADCPTPRRRRFFNCSTELIYVIMLIVMSLCRQITSCNLLQKRLITYLFLVVIGGLLNDFASFIIRAFIISLSPENFLNKYFVKWAWLWNMALLLPFITISSCTVELLEVIDLNQVEQSIEESYAEKKFSNVASKVATVCKNSTGMENDPKMAISLNSVNQNLLIQQMHESLLKNDCAEPVKMSWRWCRQNMTSFLDTIFIRDNMRMLICTMIYYLSISLFRLIQSMTSPERLKKSLQNNELTNTSSLVNIAKGFDISGHVFILIFSILIILEECAIMTGWEPLGDRLHSLSMEYTNIHLTSMAPNSICSVGRPFCNDLATNKRLFSSWVRYNCHKNQIRVLFILITLLLIVWDFMLTQTAFFYHTFAEKILALIWAYSSWYFTYRFLFPLLHLQVRRVNQ